VKYKTEIILTAGIFLLVALGVYSNLAEQKALDRSKIPLKVEQNRGFQRWITNVKNQGMDISADDFRLKEENEIYNTKWMKVSSLDNPEVKKVYEADLVAKQGVKKVVFSPSDREYIDYRNIDRDGYLSNEVHFYGQKEDKLIDARILDCSLQANCYFDRAFFLDNDVFVISEFSRNISKQDQTNTPCALDQTCEYTFKIHVVNLLTNSRLVYVSKPFNAIYNEVVDDL
jgi:hypothetical protein